MCDVNFDYFRRVFDEDPIIVLDTNVYLNLYDYTPENLSNYLNTFKSVSSSLWVPDQVQHEFYANHKTVRKRNFTKYDHVPRNLRSYLDKYKSDVDNNFLKYEELKYPLIQDLIDEIKEQLTKIESITARYEQKIKKFSEENKKVLESDSIADFLYILFENGQYGDPYTLQETLALYQEGELRYRYQIPPGYMDISKDDRDHNNQKKFGDLIIWKQMLDKAKEDKSSLIFVTNDKKEDWWDYEKDEIVGARKELNQEFREFVKEDFLMINSSLFIHYVSMLNNVELNKTLSFLENYKDDLCDDFFSKADWIQVLNKNDRLESHLIHSSDLLRYIPEPIDTLEVIKYPVPTEVKGNVTEVDYVDGQAIIMGDFYTQIAITYYVNDSNGEVLSKGTGTSWINGRFVINFGLETDGMKEIPVEGSEKISVGKIEVVGYLGTKKFRHKYFEYMCVHCNTEGTHSTFSGTNVCDSHRDLYDLCPYCDTLHDKGFLAHNNCKCRS